MRQTFQCVTRSSRSSSKATLITVRVRVPAPAIAQMQFCFGAVAENRRTHARTHAHTARLHNSNCCEHHTHSRSHEITSSPEQLGGARARSLIRLVNDIDFSVWVLELERRRRRRRRRLGGLVRKPGAAARAHEDWRVGALVAKVLHTADAAAAVAAAADTRARVSAVILGDVCRWQPGWPLPSRACTTPAIFLFDVGACVSACA